MVATHVCTSVYVAYEACMPTLIRQVVKHVTRQCHQSLAYHNPPESCLKTAARIRGRISWYERAVVLVSPRLPRAQLTDGPGSIDMILWTHV
jgi:hypothetical protein